MASRRKINHPITVEAKLGRFKAVGLAYKDAGVTVIDPRQEPKDYLDTLIHEYLHHLFPEWKEKAVALTGTALADYLWEQGYRKVSQ